MTDRKSVALALYRALGALLPPSARQDGEEMAQLFAALRDDAPTAPARWVRTAHGLVALARVLIVEWLEHVGARRPPEVIHGTGRGGMVEHMNSGIWQELPRAARRLLRRPSFAVSSVVTLGLGVAATTSVFSLVHGVVLAPLPYPDSDRIVEVDHGAAGLGRDGGLGMAYGFFRFYRDHLRTAESIAMYTRFELTLTDLGDAVSIPGVAATRSLAAVLGVRPVLGRWFIPAEEQPGASPVVVISYRLWQDRLGSDPTAVGRTIMLNATSHEIVGVMPEGFAFPDPTRAFWLPRVVPSTGIGGWNDRSVARLADGATPDDLAREMEGIFPVIRESGDDPERVTQYLDEARVHPRVVSLKESVVGDVRATLWILMGTVGVVLLISIANVANLFLVRMEDRHRDTAVRAALGAGRAQLLAGFLAETLLVVLGAGVLGVVTAKVAIDVLRARAPVQIPRLDEVALNPAVVLAALGACLFTAVLLAIVSAHRLASGRSVSPASALKEGSGRGTASPDRVLGRHALMAAQVALALVLLVGSGLLIRTFQQLRSVDLGFSERGALTFEIALPSARYGTRAEAKAFHDALLPRLEALPGVRAAAAIGSCLPLSRSMCWGDLLEVEGRPAPVEEEPIVTGLRVATAGYFDVMGITVRGRSFVPADEQGAATAAILSEAAANAYFPGEDPIGRRIRIGDDRWHTVVGVANDVRAELTSDEFTRTLYLPVLPDGVDGPPPSRLIYVVAASVPPSTLTPGVRAALGELDPLVPVAALRTLQDVVDEATAPTTFALMLIGLAAAIATLLGAIGVYAVVAYVVGGRTREIGVRMAMGARAGDVQRMVLRQGGTVVLVGIALGLAAAYLLTGVMAGLLYGVSPTDPVSYAVVTVLMLVVAGLALWIPARRAARVDPLKALRAE